MKSYSIIGLVLWSFSTLAFCNDWSDETFVKEIIAGYKEGFVLFNTTTDHLNPNGCDSTYYSLDPESADVQAALAILLAAQRSSSPIKVGLDATACGRSGIRHLANKIKVTRLRSL